LPISYRQNDKLTVKEGKLFKNNGHKFFSNNHLTVRAKHTQSRRHISPVANRIINNQDGGIILISIQDNGLMDGMMLSKAHQEYLVTNIIDTFN
jgi:hypothetical protein